eukprot:Pgem_evm1s1121
MVHLNLHTNTQSREEEIDKDFDINITQNQFETINDDDQNESVLTAFQEIFECVKQFDHNSMNFETCTTQQLNSLIDKMKNAFLKFRMVKRERGSCTSERKVKSLKERWFRKVEFPDQIISFVCQRDAVVQLVIKKATQNSPGTVTAHYRFYNKWFMYDPEHDTHKPKNNKGEVITDPVCKVHLIMVEKPIETRNFFIVKNYFQLSELEKKHWKKVVSLKSIKDKIFGHLQLQNRQL